MNQDQTLTGVVERIIYTNENGFSVFVVTIDSRTNTTVRGYLSSINPGQEVTLQGAWVTHKKFGRQFEASSCVAQQPNSVLGLKKYLSSGLIKGIGKVYGAKLVDHFGVEVLEVIEHHSDRLKEVPGIGQKRIEQIVTAWQAQKEISSIMIFLQEKGVSTVYATKIYKKYGQEAIAKVTENPYRLAEDVWGIGFKSADAIAQNLGFALHSTKRVQAGILFAISQESSQGHLYVELEKLKELAKELLELTEEHDSIVKTAFHNLYNEDKIKLLTHEEAHYVTLTQFYYSERSVALKIKKLQESPSLFSLDSDKAYQQLRTSKQHDVELNEDQQRGIMACLQNKVCVITGGPGTGKTTLLKKLLSLLDTQKISYRLAAPTGRAAKRMQEGTGKRAETIHRLLEFDVSSMSFKHNEQHALQTDMLIIDEASMIDIFLANALLKALPEHASVLFVGDIDQLPSVGPGSFLGNMIASEVVTSIRLNQIFRQAQDSMIIVNAHRINKGEFPQSYQEGAQRDYFYIKEDAPEAVINHLKKIYAKLSRYGIKQSNAAVLVPMNRGVAGTIKLNQDLQALLNPGNTKNALHYAASVFKVDDRVMQIRNNYDKLVFNGDVGTILDIDHEQKILNIDYYGRIVEYEFDEVNELVHAYAMTIHKSQGSEYDAVIVPIFMQHFMLLQRNLIYTAITRAKKLCIFIGEPRAIAMAVKNNKTTKRITFLSHYLTTDMTCR